MTVQGWSSGTCIVIDHALNRADFRCVACAAPWPCLPARVQLGEQFAADRSGLAQLMSGYLFEAVEVFLAPPKELYDRFIAWTRYPPAHPF